MYRNRRVRTHGHAPFVDEVFAEALSARPSGRRDRGARPDYKAQQLCRQVQEAMSLALAGECHDEVLRELWVESVVPAQDATHLLVSVVLPPGRNISLADVLERLDRVRGRLRASVTQAITRKRSPELTFIPVPQREVMPWVILLWLRCFIG